MQVNPKIRHALIGAALVFFAAGSVTAQIKNIPPRLANPARAIVGTQARTLRTPQALDADHDKYMFLTMDPYGQGRCFIDANGFNNARHLIVNWTDDCINFLNVQASLWDGTEWTSLDFADSNCADVSTYLTGLNERGIAFGTYWSFSCNYQLAAGIKVKRGKWFVLPDIKDYPFNQGWGMSNNGLAAGTASVDFTDTLNKHWTWDGRDYSFPTFPANWDVSGFVEGPLWINDSGEIAGQYVDTNSGVQRGYFQKGRHVTTFDAPGNPAYGTSVAKITDPGYVLVIGSYDESSQYYPLHSFIWRRGVFASLPNVPFPGAVLTNPEGLNDQGDFSGFWVDGNGLQHAFVAYRKK